MNDLKECGMSDTPPPTIIVRDAHENPRKCSVWPLRGMPGLIFVRYPLGEPLALRELP